VALLLHAGQHIVASLEVEGTVSLLLQGLTDIAQDLRLGSFHVGRRSIILVSISREEHLGDGVGALEVGCFVPHVYRLELELIAVVLIGKYAVVGHVREVLVAALSLAEALQGFVIESLDPQLIPHVDFVGVPNLLVSPRQALPVGRHVFVDLKVRLVQVQDTQAAKASLELSPKDSSKEKDSEHHETELGVGEAMEVQVVVVGELLVQAERERLSLVEEDLAVRQGPIPHQEHEDGCKLQESNSSLVQLMVIHRRLPEVVSQTEPLHQVQVEDSEQSNRDENRQEEPIHETDIHLNEDGGVLEVHQIFRACIQVDVLLLSHLLRLGYLLAAATVTDLVHLFEGPEDQEFNIRENGCYNHRLHQTRTYFYIPEHVDVRELPSERQQVEDGIR